MNLSFASVEIDSSFVNSDGLKEPGSAKRFESLCLKIKI